MPRRRFHASEFHIELGKSLRSNCRIHGLCTARCFVILIWVSTILYRRPSRQWRTSLLSRSLAWHAELFIEEIVDRLVAGNNAKYKFHAAV